ncbi:hypothetical protein [Escherichia coli]|nr:hypothetical protein [Escherichia coli]EFJ96434.1 hypothetical protein HMPREF9540_03519 [Escherichia coli MS 115-1]ESA98416.1 hypothetical protein HMPREF1620_00792 [Escherichia coli 909945-2]SMZ43032.1 hypothetical protein EC1094V2_4794 [Escherichia coli]
MTTLCFNDEGTARLMPEPSSTALLARLTSIASLPAALLQS